MSLKDEPELEKWKAGGGGVASSGEGAAGEEEQRPLVREVNKRSMRGKHPDATGVSQGGQVSRTAQTGRLGSPGSGQLWEGRRGAGCADCFTRSILSSESKPGNRLWFRCCLSVGAESRGNWNYGQDFTDSPAIRELTYKNMNLYSSSGDRSEVYDLCFRGKLCLAAWERRTR